VEEQDAGGHAGHIVIALDPSQRLADLVDYCAYLREVAIEYDADQLDAAVQVDAFVGLDPGELWRITNRALQKRGLAIVQTAGSKSLSVVEVAKAAGIARLEEDLAHAEAGYLRLLVPVRRRPLERMAEAARLVLTKEGGAVAELREANALILSDYRPNVEQALALLTRIDVSTSPPIIEEIALEEASPLALVALLERIVATRKQVAADAELSGKLQAIPDSRSVLVIAPDEELEHWRELIERFDRKEPSVSEHYAPRRFGLGETAQLIEAVVHPPDSTERPGAWRLVQDGLTGTLVITATPSRHQEIRALLARVESTERGARRPIKSFPIRNRQVSEVLGLLQGLLEAGAIQSEPEAARIEAGAQGATAPIPSRSPSVSMSEGDEAAITVSADEATNRIIALGDARLLDQLGPLIETLDVRHAQVLVEALVVSLSRTQARDLGVELQRRGTSDGDLYRLSSLFGLGSPDPAGLALPASASAGGSLAVLDPGEFSALVRALETVSEGRSITIPKVLVNNNRQARLDSLVQTPYLSTNASQTVATTSFGGSLDAGTSISVKPQVADGDQIVLDYTISLSAFLGESADPSLPPPREEQKLASVVTVPDGHTVVVGGLELAAESDGVSQMPLLGDLPILGNLFQSRSRSRSKSRFFVFLRCGVLRSSSFEDLKYHSRADLETAGIDDGWPRLEPRVIQ